MRESTGCWSGSRTRAFLAVFPLVLLAAMLASGPARADGACKIDKDCPGDLVCNAGTCMPANAPAPPPQPGAASAGPVTPAATTGAPAPAGVDLSSHGTVPEGGKCLSNPDCSPGNTCQNFICREAFFEPRVRLLAGLMYEYGIGISGTSGSSNGPNGTYSTGDVSGANLAGFMFEAGTTVDEARKLNVSYHLELGFLSVPTPSITGGHIAPLNVAFGYEVVNSGVRVEVGAIANLTSVDLGTGTWATTDGSPPNPQFTMFLQSGISLRALLIYKSFFAAIVPVGFQARWLTFHMFENEPPSQNGGNVNGQTESSAGIGINYPIGIALGMTFEKQKD